MNVESELVQPSKFVNVQLVESNVPLVPEAVNIDLVSVVVVGRAGSSCGLTHASNQPMHGDGLRPVR